MLSFPALAGTVVWSLSKLRSFPYKATFPTACLFCDPLPYTASRVQTLLCKAVIPKRGSMYVTQEWDACCQLCLWTKASSCFRLQFRRILLQSRKSLAALQGVCERNSSVYSDMVL